MMKLSTQRRCSGAASVVAPQASAVRPCTATALRSRSPLVVRAAAAAASGEKITVGTIETRELGQTGARAHAVRRQRRAAFFVCGVRAALHSVLRSARDRAAAAKGTGGCGDGPKGAS